MLKNAYLNFDKLEYYDRNKMHLFFYLIEL